MSEWTVTTLGALCASADGGIQTGPFGSQLHAEEYVAVGVPVVMPQDLGNNVIDTARIARVPESVAARLERHRLKAGDIVFSRRGDVTRRALVRSENADWLCGTGCLRVRPGQAVEPRFLAYRLGAPDAKAWLLGNAVGTNMLNLNTGILSELPVTVPGLPEQVAIAEVLGALEDKIAANSVLAISAEQLASGIYTSETAGWARVPMSRVLEPILGGTPSRGRDDFWANGDIPWVSARDVTSAPARVVSTTIERITAAAVSQTKAKPLPVGSVILTARGTVGEVARLDTPAAFNQSCYGFIPGLVPPSILYFSLVGAAAQARSVAHGSVFDTITKATFDHLEIPWELDLVAGLERDLAPLLECVSAAMRENRTLAATRDALLPQLLSGKLRVRDAEAVASAAGA